MYCIYKTLKLGNSQQNHLDWVKNKKTGPVVNLFCYLFFVKSSAPESGTVSIAPSEAGYKTAVRTVNSGQSSCTSVIITFAYWQLIENHLT